VSQSVICSGCGARLEVSEDYARKKMRCEQCGVIFDLPEPANRSSIPAPPATRPAARPTPKPQPPDKKTEPITTAPASRTRTPEPAPVSVQGTTSPAPPLEEPSPDDFDDGDDFAFADGRDSAPYEKTEGAIRECPHCHATVNPEAKACSACGFLLLKKPLRINQPLQYRWETGWPFSRRLTIFLICQVLVLALFVSGFGGGMSPYAFPLPYLVFTGMTAFLFGTYNWVDLTRSKRGRLRMTQTWRICFFLRPTTTLRLSDYEELAAGAEGLGAINWIVVLFLLICGIFAGLVVGFFFDLKLLFLVIGGVMSSLLWWIFTWHKNTYALSLCRDHGYPVITLYRGWNRQHMEDMAETICTVAQLPLRR
jgi:hypothetical protein